MPQFTDQTFEPGNADLTFAIELGFATRHNVCTRWNDRADLFDRFVAVAAANLSLEGSGNAFRSDVHRGGERLLVAFLIASDRRVLARGFANTSPIAEVRSAFTAWAVFVKARAVAN